MPQRAEDDPVQSQLTGNPHVLGTTLNIFKLVYRPRVKRNEYQNPGNKDQKNATMLETPLSVIVLLLISYL